MVVYGSVQALEFTHYVVASCLGVPENNIRVITRRVGGGFGGKAIRAIRIASTFTLAVPGMELGGRSEAPWSCQAEQT
ncbi:indole-3-acetaldehyde oxidase-like [Spinacia oleracea]|uniref:Indole-3-acetaldehyde oxidase-like n=1 Tax=Spinacia oleracea TaxID=3562 RepID=A0ABM3REC4_SPIOL|nr:indole-3-acetaldehyde oxidase-like [Spinacia oleracea]